VKFQKICVLGLGYIGLPTASTLAAHGFKVLGVDINPHVIETLQNGNVHIHEPGLRTVVESALNSGNLTVSSQPEEADAFLIAVPTPFYEDGYGEYDGRKFRLADMRAVTSATEAILPCLRKGNLVVLESTSPPRTTVDLVTPILERSGLKAGIDFFLCYSPERVLPLDMAVDIARGAIDKCRADGYRTTVAIIDAAGNLKLSARDDGTSPHTVEVARKKAYTALIYRRPSMDTAKAWATQVPPPSIEGTIALGGGFPIRAGDQVVGAIGVSGAPGQDKDEACANAGLAAVAARLK